MYLLELFKKYLLAQKGKTSSVTIKNYISDIKKFILWFEATLQKRFDPENVTQATIEDFKNAKSTSFSASSIERNISSLRKFFHFLKLEGHIASDPFEEIKALFKQSQINNDPWHLKEFKNYLYVYNASHLTIKNYIIDVKQFLQWVEKVTKTKEGWDLAEKNIFNYISSTIVEEYKKRLLDQQVFSPTSINRKLSSLRKYFAWAAEQGLVQKDLGIASANKDERKQISKDTIKQILEQPNSNIVFTEKKLATEERLQKKYSSFPPLRLMQKVYHGLTIVIEIMAITPLVLLIKSASEQVWKLRGKPVFVRENNPIQKNSFAGVKNISKLVYAPAHVSTKHFTWYQKLLFHIKFTRPEWYKRYHSYAIVHYFNWAALMIIMTIIGVGLYVSFNGNAKKNQTLASGPTAPPRILSFQGRLTDSSDNPITSGTDLRFAIYNDPTASGGALLWQEVDYNVTPDQDGIFSLLLGNNTTIPQSLFADNATLYLGITVKNTAELNPRQQIATVPYATNAEVLQGYAPTTDSGWISGASNANAVLTLNASGTVAITGTGNTNTTIQASSTNLKLIGNTTILATNVGTNGNIQFVPDGVGKIDTQRPLFNSTNTSNVAKAQGSVELDGGAAILATSSGQSAFTIEQDSTGPLISASTSGVAKFTVDSAGDLSAAGTGFFSGNLTTGGNLILSNSSATTTFGGIAYTWPTSGQVNGYVLTTNGAGTLSWTVAAGNYWQRNAGVLSPQNINDDLAIGGTATTSALFQVFGTTNGTIPGGTASTSGYLSFTNSAAKVNILNNGTLGFFNSVGGDTGIGATPALFINNNGRVGIGKTSPSTALDVNGNLTINSLINFVDTSHQITNSSGFIIQQNASGQDITVNNLQNRSIIFKTNNTETVRIDGSGNLGVGTASPLATLDVRGNSFTTPVASISGANGKASLIVDQSGIGDIFTASQAGGTRFVIANDGSLTDSKYITNNGILYTNGSGVFSQLSAGSANQVLRIPGGGGTPAFGAIDLSQSAAVTNNLGLGNGGTNANLSSLASTNQGGVAYSTGTALSISAQGTSGFCLISQGSSAPIWSSCSSAASNFWTTGNGALYPLNPTMDLLIGGSSTSSASPAIFAVVGSAVTGGSNVPTASISATSGTNSGKGVILGGDGSIQGIRNNTLTIGGNTTGTITLSPLAGGSGSILNINALTETIAATANNFTGTNPVLSATSANSSFQINANGSGNILLGQNSGTGNVIAQPNAGGQAAFMVIDNGVGDLFTASAGATPKFTIQNSGAIKDANYTGNPGGVIFADTNGLFGQTATGNSGQCLISQGGGTPQWANCSTGTAGTNYWTITQGALNPINTSLDLLVGGTSTSSANPAIFAVTGSAVTGGSNVPTASISATSGTNAGKGIILGGDGTIQGIRENSITIGGDKTGNITLSPLNGGTGSTLTINALTESNAATAINLTGTNPVIAATTTNSALDIKANGGGLLTLNSGATGNIQFFNNNNTITSGGALTINSTLTVNGATETIGNGSAATIQTSGNANLTVSAGSGTLNLNTAGNGAVTTGTGLTTLGGNLTVNGATISLANASSSTIQTTGSNTSLTLLSNGSGNIILGQNAGTGNITLQPNAGGQAALTLIDNGVGDLFTASAGATTKFTIQNSGAIKDANYTSNPGGLLYADSTGLIGQTTTGSTGQCLVSQGGSTPSWATCQTGATILWNQSLGALYPANSTVDLLVGGTSTSSANPAIFAVTGSAVTGGSNVPTASISATSGTNAGKGIILGGDGTIQGIRNNSIIIGGNTTGNITLSPLAGGTGSTLTINALTQSIAATANNFTGSNPVLSATAANSSLQLVANGSGNILLGQNSGTGNITIQPNAGGQAALTLVDNGVGDIFTASAGANTRFVIKNGGNVGIGTNAPKATLETIAAGAYTNTENQTNGIMTSTGHTASDYGLYMGGDATNMVSYIQSVNLGVTVAPIVLNGRGGNVSVGAATPLGNTALVVNQSNWAGAGFDIFTASSGGTTKFTIANDGTIKNNLTPNQSNTYDLGTTQLAWRNLFVNNIYAPVSGGTVGFWQLNNNVLAPSNLSNDLAIGGNATGSAFQVFAETVGTTIAGTASTSGQLTFTGGATKVNLFNGSSLGFFNSVGGVTGINTTPALFIAGAPTGSTGNVGIGTGNPQAQLDVNSSFRLGVGGSTAGTIFATGFTHSAGSLTAPDIYGNGTNALVLAGKSNGTGIVSFGTGTQVGIGTNSPATKAALDIENDSQGNAELLINNLAPLHVGDIIAASSSGETELRLDSGGTLYTRRFDDLDNINYFLDPAAASISLTTQGKVGINNTNPTAYLDLISPQNSGNSASISAINTTSGNILSLVPPNPGPTFTGNIINVASANTNYMTLTGAGNLGINTATPSSKLQVLGDTQIGFDSLGWGVAGYSQRRQILIQNNSGSTLTNYQQRIVIDTATLISASKMQSTCKDVRFTDEDGTTLLNFWREYGCNTNTTVFWVKVPTMPGGMAKRIYVYYNNANETTDVSSSSNTFTAEISGVQGAWKFDSFSTLVPDFSGNNNVGTVSGSVGVGLGQFYNSANFPGASQDFVEVANAASLNNTTTTWSAWVNTTQSASNAVVMSKTDTSSATNGIVMYINSGTPGCQMKNGATTATLTATGAGVADGSWHYIACTFTPSGTSTIYVDGVSKGTATGPSSFTFTTQPLRFGKANDTTSFPTVFTGRIDEARIYNSQLSSGTISTLYGTGSVNFLPPVLYYGYVSLYNVGKEDVTLFTAQAQTYNLQQEQNTTQSIPSFYVQNTTGDIGIGTNSMASSSAKLTVNGDIKSGTYDPTAWGSNFSSYKYRQRILIDNTASSAALTNYQVLVQTDTNSPVNNGKMRNDCGDIRFADSDGNTSLNYWLEKDGSAGLECGDSSSNIFVKVPTIPANSKKYIYMYYGNPAATSSSSGTNTFNFFDDFTTFDTTNTWTATGATSASTNNLNITTGAVYSKSAAAVGNNTQPGYIVEANMDWGTQTANDFGVLGISNSTSIGSGNSGSNKMAWLGVSNGNALLGAAGDGTSATYNITNAGTPIVYPQFQDFTFYIAGIAVTPNQVVYQINRSNASATSSYNGTWSAAQDIILGDYKGSGTSPATTDTTDTSFLWVIVRQYSANPPPVSVDSEQDSSQVNSTLYVSNTQQRVGIGTANPNAMLDVVGNDSSFEQGTNSFGNVTIAEIEGTRTLQIPGVCATCGGYTGLNVVPYYNSSSNLGTFNGIQSDPVVIGSANVSNMYGLVSQPDFNGTGNATNVYGLYSNPFVQNTTNAYGSYSLLSTFGNSGSVKNGYGFYSAVSNGAVSALQNFYGLYIASPSGQFINHQYAIVTEPNSGNVGIGTITPSQTLSVNGSGYFNPSTEFFNGSPTGIYMGAIGTHPTVELVENGANSWELTTGQVAAGTFSINLAGTGSKLSVDGSGNVRATRFIGNFNGTCLIGGSHFNTSNGSACDADLAEVYSSSEDVASGDLLSFDTATSSSTRKAAIPYDPTLMGIVTTSPGIVLANNGGGFLIGVDANSYESSASALRNPAVALNGQVPLTVSDENGQIHTGDFVTSSSLAGFAMKATKAGRVIGMAMQNFNSSQATIETLPNGKSVKTEKIMVFVNPTWYDPDVYLTNTGDINLNDTMTNADFAIPHYYTLSDVLNGPITRVERLGQAVIANLQVGSLNAQQTITNSLAVATNNVTIAGQSLNNYIISVVQNAVSNGTIQQWSNQSLISPLAQTDHITTNVISPLAQDSNISVKFNQNSIAIYNDSKASGSAVAEIDNQGNATFSGTLNSGNLAVNGDATISGTLHVNQIQANQIAGLSAAVGTLSAQNITNVTNIYFATPSGTPLADNSSQSGNLASSQSGSLLADNWSPQQSTDIASYSAYLAYVPNLHTSFAQFDQGLMALGPTSLSDTTIAGELAINGNFIFSNDSINVLGADLAIQPLRQGGIAFEDNQVKIDTNGNLTVNGNAVFNANVAIKMISPLPGQDLSIQLSDNSQTPSSESRSSLLIKNSSGSAVVAFNSTGDITASGEGTFSKININSIIPQALAVSGTEIIATGSAGQGQINIHQKEITIDNTLVTDKSLIYITPVGNTNGFTPYLERQVPGKSFSVGISDFTLQPIEFNWLVIN